MPTADSAGQPRLGSDWKLERELSLGSLSLTEVPTSTTSDDSCGLKCLRRTSSSKLPLSTVQTSNCSSSSSNSRRKRFYGQRAPLVHLAARNSLSQGSSSDSASTSAGGCLPRSVVATSPVDNQATYSATATGGSERSPGEKAKAKRSSVQTELDRCKRQLSTWLDLSEANLARLGLAEAQQLGALAGHLQNLSMHMNKLVQVPSELIQLVQLRELSLAGNLIRELPGSMRQLSELRHLDLRYNKLKQVPSFVSHLDNLVRLRLDHNRISSLPSDVDSTTSTNNNNIRSLSSGQFKQLSFLSLRHNKLKQLKDEQLRQFVNLITLDLSHNQLERVPDSLCQLEQLTCIDLQYNRLRQLPQMIGNLRQLSRIRLHRNKLEHLPDSLVLCTNLNELYLDRNQIFYLPSELLRRLNFRHLTLSRNRLVDFPGEGSVKFRNMSTMSLEHNHISKIPFGIFAEAAGFVKLIMNNNELRSLPLDVGNWKQIEHLELANNKLQRLPDDLQHLQCLRVLNLANNQLRSIPTTLGSLKTLRILDLSNNQLDSLPSELGKLSQLEVLDVSGNMMLSLPRQIGCCQRLTELNASRNQLCYLPEELGEFYELNNDTAASDKSTNSSLACHPALLAGNLDSLERLHLADNPALEGLPVELGLCQKLTAISCTGCPLSRLPPDLLVTHSTNINNNNNNNSGAALVQYLRFRSNYFLSCRVPSDQAGGPASSSDTIGASPPQSG